MMLTALFVRYSGELRGVYREVDLLLHRGAGGSRAAGLYWTAPLVALWRLLQPPPAVEKLAWICIQDRRVLFARSKKQPKLFYTVGGKPEIKQDGTKETDEEVLVREVEEETEVSLIPGSIQHLHNFEGPCHGYPPGTKLIMRCYLAQHIGMPTPSGEIAELAWFTAADEYRTTVTGKEILRWLKARNLIA